MKSDLEFPTLSQAEWLNHPTQTPPETKGHPTLLHFWSIDSEPSKTHLPHVAELRDNRKKEGLRVIAVHVPCTEQRTAVNDIRKAIVRLNLTEPCVLDSEHKLSDAFANDRDILPRYYLFDTDGRLLSDANGEHGSVAIEEQLDQLLARLRTIKPFCPQCELFLNEEALFCAECGQPLILPASQGTHPYYESHHFASLPTVRLFDPDPLIGHVIGDKYELTARLGEGAMSVVYRARRVHIGDEVAVKILLRKFVKNDSVLARFRREARATAMLHHPNVITIHDFGETTDGDTAAFIVMEFVKGTPLRGLLKGENQFPLERALRLMRGICAGVGAAHRQGVVHRDLKPENIIVVAPDDDYEYETVRVVDFGFAKVLADADASLTTTVMGTPYYMSPEQCLGETLDARSDVYSLGAMFYEMLSGKPPFAADTVSGIIGKQLGETPPPFLPSLNIPRRISAAIQSALAKEPDDRPQTATDLARQIRLV